MKWGSTDRPADQPQDGAVRDAARPGSYVGNVLGSCAREAASQLAMADRRVVKLRPVPQEPCRRREEPASVQGALRPGCPRGRSERRSNRCECVLRGGLRESEAQSYAADPGFGGRESSRFLGTKHWKSQKLSQLSPEQPSEWKARDGEIGPYAQIARSVVAPMWQTSDRPYFLHSPKVRTRRSHRRSNARFRSARTRLRSCVSSQTLSRRSNWSQGNEAGGSVSSCSPTRAISISNIGS